MARLALALDPATEDRLLADVVEHGHTIVARLVGWRDVLESLDVLAPDVVLVGAGARHAERGAPRRRATSAASGSSRSRPATPIVRTPHSSDSTRCSTARRRGPRSTRSCAAVCPSRRGWATRNPAARRSAAVIAVWGPAGAPGRTTLAVNLAAEIAASGHSVALVDADPYGGAIAPSLGLLDEAPGFASACRLAGGDALDRVELERIAQRYSAPRASFDVFTGLVGPSRWPELSRERVTAAIQAIGARSEYVVIDTGFSLERDEELTSDQFAPRRNAATFASLAAADRVAVVGLADPVGLSRLLRGHGDLVDLVEPERIDVIVNRVRTGALGIDAHAQVRQTLRRFAGIADATLLPHDGRATDAAILTARTLRDAAPRSPLRAALREYALDRILPVPQPARRRGFAFAPMRRAAAS